MLLLLLLLLLGVGLNLVLVLALIGSLARHRHSLRFGRRTFEQQCPELSGTIRMNLAGTPTLVGVYEGYDLRARFYSDGPTAPARGRGYLQLTLDGLPIPPGTHWSVGPSAPHLTPVDIDGLVLHTDRPEAARQAFGDRAFLGHLRSALGTPPGHLVLEDQRAILSHPITEPGGVAIQTLVAAVIAISRGLPQPS